MNDKQEIVVVWFKRDLRLFDNESVHEALLSGKKVVLLYLFEDSLLTDEHYAERHWNFIKESLVDINKQLIQFNTKVITIQAEALMFFKLLIDKFKLVAIYSHQETGILKTFRRDITLKRFCKNNNINWVECINNGVFRGRSNRDNWIENWEEYMYEPCFDFTPTATSFIALETISYLTERFKTVALDISEVTNFQKGGRSFGLRYLNTFFESRYKNYAKHISKPTESRESCSRLSPYLAWGNLSVREVFQQAKKIRKTSNAKRAIDAFTSRLRWQAHFIQKFEMEWIMEHESINKGFHKLKKKVALQYQEAWKTGTTGIPFIDACMRCLVNTGYLNFRMRAMVVSFFTHNLWQPWQDASKFLSRMFLDFEPGIHFPQLQMQAGETGVNTLRIYNPIKNGKEHDPEAVFITKWLPELKDLPIALRHEPYLVTDLEERLYKFKLNENYPAPIIDVAKTRKRASDTIWAMRKDKEVQKESRRILKKHVGKQ